MGLEGLNLFRGKSINEIEAVLRTLDPRQVSELEDICSRDYTTWAPLPGPQAEAYYSTADIIGYGDHRKE